jgi:hypothetical protein
MKGLLVNQGSISQIPHPGSEKQNKFAENDGKEASLLEEALKNKRQKLAFNMLRIPPEKDEAV